MLRRLIRWNVIDQCEYVMVDETAENIEYASGWVNVWAEEAGLHLDRSGKDWIRIHDQTRDVKIQFKCADVFDFVHTNNQPADLLIAHAFLDLLPMPDSLSRLLSLTDHLAWLTINFDGVSTFEPVINEELDKKIEHLYHESMDTRSSGGDSRSGRHLFEYLRSAGVKMLEAGASDWVVYPKDGNYPDDEAYFLDFILHFFEESLRGHSELNADEFNDWISKRRVQIERKELLYIAHQMDFLIQV